MGGSFDDLKKLSSARKASVDSARPRLRKSTTENDDDLKDDDEDALKEEEEEEEFEFNEHHALTLTGLSGKRLKRELSRHQLFQGLEDTQSPETTPGGTLTMESAQTLAAETDLIRDAKVVSGAGGRDGSRAGSRAPHHRRSRRGRGPIHRATPLRGRRRGAAAPRRSGGGPRGPRRPGSRSHSGVLRSRGVLAQ